MNSSHESVEQTLGCRPGSLREKAFQTLLKNRTYHGGILAHGSGVIKYGENGRGVKSRWYPETISKRFEAIYRKRERLSFLETDGLEVMRRSANSRDTVFFIDPPYTAGGKNAGTRLYTHSEVNHEDLFRIVQSLAGDFIMTYDNTPEILGLAHAHGFQTRAIPMKNTHNAAMTELLVGRNLNWAQA